MLTRKTIGYIQRFKEENDCTSSEAVDRIVFEHKNREIREQQAKHFSETMADKIYERFHKDLVRIRLGTNAADKNTQILLEMLNILMTNQKAHTKFMPTEKLDTPVLVQAKEHVTRRIAKYKQRKDSKSL